MGEGGLTSGAGGTHYGRIRLEESIGLLQFVIMLTTLTQVDLNEQEIKDFGNSVSLGYLLVSNIFELAMTTY